MPITEGEYMAITTRANSLIMAAGLGQSEQVREGWDKFLRHLIDVVGVEHDLPVWARFPEADERARVRAHFSVQVVPPTVPAEEREQAAREATSRIRTKASIDDER